MPCPRTWTLPFPRGVYPDIEFYHKESQRLFFSRILPGLKVLAAEPIPRGEHSCCSWQIYFQVVHCISNVSYNHIYKIINDNKCGNCSIAHFNCYDPYNFSVIYNIQCSCNTVDYYNR